mgnify:CR=1 FL=1
MTKVKICGLRTQEDVKIVNRYLPAYAGFVFAGTKRKTLSRTARNALFISIKQHKISIVRHPFQHLLWTLDMDIGESLMRSRDKAGMLKNLRGM